MALDPLAVGFRDRFRQVVVRIKATWVESGEQEGTLASGQGFVELNGRRQYLGRFDLPETQQRYHRLSTRNSAT